MKKLFPLLAVVFLISAPALLPARNQTIAVDTKRSALDAAKAKKDDHTKGAQARLALYQQHKPYRDVSH